MKELSDEELYRMARTAGCFDDSTGGDGADDGKVEAGQA
jgi:hypothetical protein